MEWYKAFFCKDVSSYPLNELCFDIVVETEDERDREMAKIEDAGWGALTHWQHIGSIIPGEAMMLERKGSIVKAKSCRNCATRTIDGQGNPCLNKDAPHYRKRTDFTVRCPLYKDAGPWVKLTYYGD